MFTLHSVLILYISKERLLFGVGPCRVCWLGGDCHLSDVQTILVTLGTSYGVILSAIGVDMTVKDC